MSSPLSPYTNFTAPLYPHFSLPYPHPSSSLLPTQTHTHTSWLFFHSLPSFPSPLLPSSFSLCSLPSPQTHAHTHVTTALPALHSHPPPSVCLSLVNPYHCFSIPSSISPPPSTQLFHFFCSLMPFPPSLSPTIPSLPFDSLPPFLHPIYLPAFPFTPDDAPYLPPLPTPESREHQRGSDIHDNWVRQSTALWWWWWWWD